MFGNVEVRIKHLSIQYCRGGGRPYLKKRWKM